LGLEPPWETSAMEVRRESPAAHARLLAHDLDHRRDRFGATLRLLPDRLEEPQPVADERSARGGRRIRQQLVPAERAADGSPPDDAVPGQVFRRQDAAAALDVSADRATQIAGVDRGRA